MIAPESRGEKWVLFAARQALKHQWAPSRIRTNGRSLADGRPAITRFCPLLGLRCVLVRASDPTV